MHISGRWVRVRVRVSYVVSHYKAFMNASFLMVIFYIHQAINGFPSITN